MDGGDGDDGDLSISISEQDSYAPGCGDLKIHPVDVDPSSPVDGGGDLGKGLKNHADATGGEDTSKDVEEDEGGEGEREEADLTSSVTNPPVVVVRDVDGSSDEGLGDFPKRRRPSRLSHQRNESVPLKRYDIESAAAGLHISSATSRIEEDLQSDRFHEADHSTYIQRRDSKFSEAEDAGLDFVDVSLDREVTPRSPYGPGAFYASRSAVEIRQDSISSNSDAAKRAASEAEERDRRFKEQQLYRRERSTSDGGTSTSSRSSQTTGHTVKGRYMRRRSRAASPEPHNTINVASSSSRSSSLSLNVPQANDVPAIGGGLIMAVAGEDGEINMLSVEDRAMPAAADLEQNSPARESTELEAGNGDRHEIEETREHDCNSQIEGEGSSAVAEDTDEIAVTPTMPSAESNNSLNDAADKKEGKRRRTSSNKPSALEQHVSRTRMTNLPPKPKDEDVKHLHDFEAMMKLSKEVERKKQQESEEKKQSRDLEVQESMKVWDKDILPSWTRARREVKLRKLWWKGIPSSIRGRLWALSCGNNQMLPRNLYNKATAEAKKRIDEARFPAIDMHAIDMDIAETLPSLKLFQKETGPLYDDLYSVLCAFVIVQIDREEAKGSFNQGEEKVQVYQEGAASLAAMLLTNLSPAETLIALVNLIAERPWLRALFVVPSTAPTTAKSKSSKQDPAAGFERVFDTLLADQMPKVYANMQARGVRPSAYVTRWVKTLFVPYLTFDVVARLWDCILLDEGDALIFRTGIALISLLSARLYVPDKKELISILRGNNRAALSVWDRVRFGSGPLSPSLPKPNGSETSQVAQKHLSVEAPLESVPLDNIYGGQYDINETNLFQVLEEQGSWWKDSTLERLLDRELVT
ncbi:hypothetical protein CBS101457_001633 [Exobasidium rhododendri]|nr:hypothetical protein CBS101457_001633 [Exobasidium rhododendri]